MWLKKLKDLWINNFKEWGEDGPEYWWPTMIWLQLEIYEFQLFKICFDFHEMTFEVYLFGFGIIVWPWDKKKAWFHRTKIDMKYKRVQIVVSCAMYWHFFQIYNDTPDFFIEIFGQRTGDKEMKKDETFEEFKEKTEVIMKKDLKKIIKSYHKLPKTKYMVLKELVKINPMKDVLHTVWITGFHEGTRQALIEFKKQKKKNK